MNLNLAQVFEKVGNQDIGYVFDAPYHYIVLTRNDNTFDLDHINQFIAVLDQIEATTGPGVVVTIGTGKKHFSTGFDLPYWMKSYDNFRESIIRFQELLARVVEFPLPTMCVFNGNAIAGGFILGLAHDFRVMHESNGAICLSELKLGLPLPPPYMGMLAHKLSARVANKIAFGITLPQSEALKEDLIDETYGSVEQLQTQLATFAKRYASFGVHRHSIKTNKNNQFEELLQSLRSFKFPPTFDAVQRSNYANTKKTVQAMYVEKQEKKQKQPKKTELSPKL